MKTKLTILLLNIFLLTFSQTKIQKIGGQFGWAGPEEGDPWGELIVYPKTDTTFLFYLRASTGELNESSIITGQAKLIDNNKFEYLKKGDDFNCKIIFDYHDNYFFIKTQNEYNNCNGEALNNLTENFMRESDDIPDFYTIGTTKIYFKDMK